MKKYAGVFHALLAALFFGASTPFSKMLLKDIHPVPLASLLYLGSGAGMVLLKLFEHRRAGDESTAHEAKLTKMDLPALSGAILTGGVIAPILLLTGLNSTPGATASLLLNFEAAATTMVAMLFFREAVDRQVWLSVAFITTGSAFLTIEPSDEWGISPGALFVLGACICWGMDNNFTRLVSSKDTTEIVVWKGLAAGTASMLISLALKLPLPSIKTGFIALTLGFFSYGLSIKFFVLAMRTLGAARTGAYFATAPFTGALLSFLLMAEKPAPSFIPATFFMLAGVYLLLKEKHSHIHTHEFLEHEHSHSHDDGHHEHHHDGEELSSQTVHSHPHIHRKITHEHPHTPDIHHRHEH